jgi:multiple sugar transport system substrate-binding protein
VDLYPRKRLTSRRQFLGAVGLGLAGITVLGACAPAPAPTAVPAPAKPTEAPKAAAPTTAPAAPTAAPKPTEAPKPTAPAAAAAPTAAPAQPTAVPAATAKPAMAAGKLVAWAFQSFTPEGDKQLALQAEAFGKESNQQVEYVPMENKVVPQKLAAAIEAKTPPDIQMLTSASTVLFYGAKDLLVDLTDVWNKNVKQACGFFESVLDLYALKGKFLGIPFETDSSPLFCRLDLMEQATGKREPPKTMDEMYEAAKKITKPPSLYAIGICLGRVPDTAGNMQNVIWNDGGALVDKAGKPALKSEGTLTAIKRVQQWWKDKVIPPDSTTWDDTGNNNAYQSKQVAFAINPPSIYDWLQKNDKDLLNNTTMAAIPAGKAGSFAGSGSWSWSVFNGSKNVDGAKGLINYWMVPDRCQEVYEKVGGRWYPIYKDLKNKEYWTSRPHFKFYPDMIATGRVNSYPAAPEPNLMTALGDVAERFVVADMIQAVLVKNQAPEQALDVAQKAMEDIFKKYNIG